MRRKDCMRRTSVLFRRRVDGRGNRLYGDHTFYPNTGLLFGFLYRKFLTYDRQPYILDRSCEFCGGVDEDAQHLFFQCTVSAQLWARMWDWLGVQSTIYSMRGLMRWLRRGFRGTGLRARHFQSGITAIVYHIWSARNIAMFDYEKPEVNAIFKKILIHIHQSMSPD